MLIDINEEGKLASLDWKACPEFKSLTEAEMRCVVLVWDNDSLYRRMDVADREKRIMIPTLGDKAQKFIDSARYKEASFMYRAMNYDYLLEIRNTFEKKIIGLQKLLENLEMSDDPKIQKKYDDVVKNISSYRKQITEFDKEIQNRGKVSTSFKTILSGYEKFQERARQLKAEGSIFLNAQ